MQVHCRICLLIVVNLSLKIPQQIEMNGGVETVLCYLLHAFTRLNLWLQTK